ncbi:ArnT family glycosyltransferase, partial [Patescibacteria group bacterium]
MSKKLRKFIVSKTTFYLILISFLYLVPRTVSLGKDISNTDAYRWHYRSQNFLTALKEGSFKDTYQHYQPGVTLMWINSFVKQASFSIQYHLLNIDNPQTLENADFFPIIHGFSKLFLVLVLFGTLITQIWLIRRIYNANVALLFGFLMALEPYLVGIDRWFHLTSLEAYFGITSILFILMWRKNNLKRYIIYSAIFFALAFLSKLTSIILFPTILFTMALFFYHKDKNIWIKHTLKHWLVFTLVFLLTVFVLFPALTTSTFYVINELFVAARTAAFGGETYPYLSKFSRIFFYDLILILKLSPITILLVLLGVAKRKIDFKNINNIILFIALFTYYFFLSFSNKKIDRYAISMIPYIVLFSAIALNKLNFQTIKIVLVGLVLHFILVSYIYFPVYSSYNSLLLGGTSVSVKHGFYDNSGEYFAQAARYLNSKSRNVNTYVPNGESSFKYYYKGKFVFNAKDADYIVTSLDSTRLTPNSQGCLV